MSKPTPEQIADAMKYASRFEPDNGWGRQTALDAFLAASVPRDARIAELEFHNKLMGDALGLRNCEVAATREALEEIADKAVSTAVYTRSALNLIATEALASDAGTQLLKELEALKSAVKRVVDSTRETPFLTDGIIAQCRAAQKASRE